MKEDLYYFAHPFTVKNGNGENAKEKEEINFNLCNMRVAKLLKKGYFVYSPISHCYPVHIADSDFWANDEYDLWINLDKLIIEKTKFRGIILAPKWEKSKGCLQEKERFEKKRLEVLLYTDLVKD